jgi:hypothetical protein
MTEKWHIHEGFFLQAVSSTIMELVYEPDNASILITVDEIDDLVKALRLAQSYYDAKSLKAESIEALTRWGKERTPALD